jgi:hypothetical protein
VERVVPVAPAARVERVVSVAPAARVVSVAAALVAIVVLQTGCFEMRGSESAVSVLIDVSGTYADQKEDVVKILKREVIPALEPGDTLIAILVDSESYEKENVVALTTLDARPSRANAQKLALSQKLDALVRGGVRARHTDLPGAMMLASEYLKESSAPTRVMLVFSDLREDLPKGARRELRENEFAGIHLVAMNVKRLGTDSSDPERYRQRLEAWRERVERAGGAGWQVVMDTSKLGGVLEAIRS